MVDVKVIQLLTKAVHEGRFGNNVQLKEIIPDNTKGEDQFASSVVFVTVKLNEHNVSKSVQVVIKMQLENDILRQFINSDSQFYNEALMYEKMLPFLNVNNIISEIFPNSYYCYASFGKPKEDIIIIENLKSFDFRLTTEKVNLSYVHCVLAFKKLGRFHALSYAAKHRDLNSFMNKVNQIKEVHYLNEQKDILKKYYKPSMMRGVLPLLKEPEYVKILENFRCKINEPFNLMKDLIHSEEPLAVVCHGDFCRNNVLFKYQDDKPIDVKFFDLATSRYASPVIDISFFLFLNVPSEIRNKHWDDLLEIYHNALSNAVPGTIVPTLEDIKTEMQKKAVYGYVLSSFFIPFMKDSKDMEDPEILFSLPQSEIDHILLNNGGEEMTQVVVAMVRDLILRKCL